MNCRLLTAVSLTVLPIVIACGTGSDDPAGDRRSPTEPPIEPPLETAMAAVLPFATEEATSRRFDVTLAVPDSGLGVARIELWMRPDSGAWSLAGTTDTLATVRTTIPAAGPFGVWDFAAVAVPTSGVPVDTLAGAEATILIPEPITITDNGGEVWEITHAVKAYGMTVAGWGEGIGRHTLRPVIDPLMSSPGDGDYPEPENLAVVIGTVVADEARAYRLSDLGDVEVVDDTVGDVPIAVTY